jgi:hypothetical protein
MSIISAVSARPIPAPQVNPVRVKDADGDNDGTQVAKTIKPAVTAVSQPVPPATETKGSNVNLFA